MHDRSLSSRYHAITDGTLIPANQRSVPRHALRSGTKRAAAEGLYTGLFEQRCRPNRAEISAEIAAPSGRRIQLLKPPPAHTHSLHPSNTHPSKHGCVVSDVVTSTYRCFYFFSSCVSNCIRVSALAKLHKCPRSKPDTQTKSGAPPHLEHP
jgi:hypothetical protein